MLNDKESPFTLTLTDSGLRLPVLRFSGLEALNQPYRFEVDVVGLGPALTPETWLQRPAFLQMNAAAGVHGLVQSVSCEHHGPYQMGYHAVLVPHLQKLAHPPRRRVFTQLSVPAIIDRLLISNGLGADSFRLHMNIGAYPTRPFCIQYEESDFALLQRLCEEEGIHYHFEHRPDGHVVVFADDGLNLPQQLIEMAFDAANTTAAPVISRLFQQHDARVAPVIPAIRNRGQSASAEQAANQAVAQSAALRLPLAQRHAEERGRRQLQRQRCQHATIQGRSHCGTARSGHLLQVSEHPMAGFNNQWLLTELRHHGQQPLLEASLAERRYYNDFTAQPWSSDFRPPLKQPRANMSGYHLARIAGEPGQPPRLDEQGRIAVQLWPGADVADDCAICLPIAFTSGSAATHDLPRAGSEVWVSFLDGDPDRPLLCLGASSAPKPEPLPPEPADDLLLDWLLNPAQP